MKHSVIILSLILLLSCHRTSEQVEPQSFDFETTIDATFDKVKINEVIKPVDFARRFMGRLHFKTIFNTRMFTGTYIMY